MTENILKKLIAGRFAWNSNIDTQHKNVSNTLANCENAKYHCKLHEPKCKSRRRM